MIEDDVEIQTLTSVDRATVGETRVKRGAKIDSLVQVGHACVVGEDNIICAQTGLAGSTVLEKNVLLAGQVGISGHLTIHDNAVVYAQSGIGGDVAAGAVISRIAGVRRARMAARHHRVPEAAGIAEDGATIGKASQQSRKSCEPNEHAQTSNYDGRPPRCLPATRSSWTVRSPPLRILTEYLEPLSHFRRREDSATRSYSSARRA